MNGFELNKLAAAILVAGIIAMLSGYGAKVFFLEDSHQEAKRGYQIEVTESDDSSAKPAGPKIPSFEVGALMAKASAQNGQNVFKKCQACHGVEKGGPNRVGPNLWNVVNAQKAHHEGYTYSTALAARGGEKWGYEELFAFMYSPKDYVKGTKMGFAGIKKPEEIADLVAYLRTLNDNPPALPAADLVSKEY